MRRNPLGKVGDPLRARYHYRHTTEDVHGGQRDNDVWNVQLDNKQAVQCTQRCAQGQRQQHRQRHRQPGVVHHAGQHATQRQQAAYREVHAAYHDDNGHAKRHNAVDGDLLGNDRDIVECIEIGSHCAEHPVDEQREHNDGCLAFA